MPDYTEEQKAGLASRRGQIAAGIKDSEERKKFVSAQGEAEKSGKPDYESLETSAFQERNKQAVSGASNEYSNAPYSLARKSS